MKQSASVSQETADNCQGCTVFDFNNYTKRINVIQLCVNREFCDVK